MHIILHVYDSVELYLTAQMEELGEIVGAQVSRAALGDVGVQGRGVRLGISNPLTVLQRHVNPVEQLRGSVPGDPRFYGRRHVAPLRSASFGTAPSEPLGFFFADPPASFRHPPRPWGATRDFTAGSPTGPQEPANGRRGERSGRMKRTDLNAGGGWKRPELCCVTAKRRSDTTHFNDKPRIHCH